MSVLPSDVDVRPSGDVEVHSAAPTVTLNRSGDPWIGTFPGLGTVRVWADGRVEAEAEPGVDGVAEGKPGADGADGTGADGTGAHGADGESAELRVAALLHGWGEPLALARRGFHIATATAILSPDTEQCLLISGDPHDTAILMLGLAAQGWRVLADRLTPVVVDGSGDQGAGGGVVDGSGAGGGVVAHPRPGPVLTSARRAATAGMATSAVRADTDTAAVDVPRTDTPHPVAALVTARIRRPHDPVLAELRGHRRVETANTLFATGALAPDGAGLDGAGLDGAARDAAAAAAAAMAVVMARTMRVAALPMAAVHLDPADPAPAIDALVDWWTSR